MFLNLLLTLINNCTYVAQQPVNFNQQFEEERQRYVRDSEELERIRENVGADFHAANQKITDMLNLARKHAQCLDKSHCPYQP